MANKFWGNLLEGIFILPAAGAGLVKGTYNAATGNGTFSEGFEETGNAIIKGVGQFGDDHNDAITKKLVEGAAGALGGLAIKEGWEHTHHPTKNHNS
jgi:hypothetical protein